MGGLCSTRKHVVSFADGPGISQKWQMWMDRSGAWVHNEDTFGDEWPFLTDKYLKDTNDSPVRYLWSKYHSITHIDQQNPLREQLRKMSRRSGGWHWDLNSFIFRDRFTFGTDNFFLADTEPIYFTNARRLKIIGKAGAILTQADVPRNRFPRNALARSGLPSTVAEIVLFYLRTNAITLGLFKAALERSGIDLGNNRNMIVVAKGDPIGFMLWSPSATHPPNAVIFNHEYATRWRVNRK